jgi:hypothetical protein
MKLLLYLVLSATIFFPGSSPKSNLQEGLKVKTFVKGVFNVSNEKTLFMIGLKLKNISNTSIEFWTMTCTTVGNIVFDSDKLELVVNNCASNFPRPVILKPEQEFDFTFLIKASDSYPKKIKIGWIILNKENTQFFDYYSDNLFKFREKLENVLWADPIELNCCAFDQYEIK